MHKQGRKDYRTVFNCGAGAQQSVFHLHFHVIPRWPDDGFSTWPAGRSGHDLAADPIPLLAGAFEASFVARKPG